MKLLLQTLFFSFLAFSVTSCDNDDDMEEPATVCAKAVTFLVDGVEACATGTFSPGVGTSTAFNLTLDGGGTLTVAVFGGVQTIAIPTGSAIYTAADGTVFSSTSGGILTVTANDPTLDAVFNFDAADNSGATVSITDGVVTGLPQ